MGDLEVLVKNGTKQDAQQKQDPCAWTWDTAGTGAMCGFYNAHFQIQKPERTATMLNFRPLYDHPADNATKWNQGFQSGFEAGRINNSEVRKALADLKHDHRTFVNNTSIALMQNDERIHQLEKKLKDIYQECVDICERRANSLRDGADVARQCGKDILSRSTSV